MKKYKKFFSVILCAALICVLFSACSSGGGESGEITEDTMLIAYTQEISPFIYMNSSGQLEGFDVDLIKDTFDSFKGDYKNYKFVQVDENYVLGEDPAYTDENGNDYYALIFCGGMHKNQGTYNEDYSWSEDVLKNDIITVVPKSSSVKSYGNIAGAKAGVLNELCANALDENTAVKNNLASLNVYNSSDELFAALDSGAVDAAVIDSFSFYSSGKAQAYTALNGALDSIEYAYAFYKNEDYSEGFNEAVKEMLSPDYGEGDTLTPLVEKYFGFHEACVFTYETE
ncbi:MAG: transporter substrate-binding domain-containing protein [Clostridiales bacterium]|nr:transporter substrate-binding domain-containing protein [Clostridiales bacterium]